MLVSRNWQSKHVYQLSVFLRNQSTAASATQLDNEESVKPEKSTRVLAEPNKRPSGFNPAPYTRKISFRSNEPSHVYKEYLNEGDASGMGSRLTDYYWMQDYVKQLDTPQERIDFVNPHQRSWSRFEKRWHRVFHPTLTKPRKAWAIPTIPNYFDSLDFYKYITKTRLVGESKAMDDYYSGLVPPTSKFERRLTESLLTFFEGQPPKDDKSVQSFLRAALDDAQLSISHNVDWIQKYRQSTNPRCESFWIRGGFLNLYDQLEIWDDDGQPARRKDRFRFVGDDSRKLGELAFTMRDTFAAQLRAKSTLPEIVSLDGSDVVKAPLFPENWDVPVKVVYSPTQFNLGQDGEALWMCPGYEADSNEPFKFGRLAVKSTFELNSFLDFWKIPEGSERDETVLECLSSTAIASLFSWLNGQAHCLGFTQYNDIEEPLVSQIILFDGKRCFFALGQLNTIAINVEMDGFINRKSNLCLVDGPHNLFDEFDSESKKFRHISEKGSMVDGLNPKVLSRFLQMLMIGRQK